MTDTIKPENENKTCSYFTKSMTDLQAITYACKRASEWHKKQTRKDSDKTPYINHPIEVAEFLTFNGITDRDVIIAAYLHDVVEDTDGTYEDIRVLFGDNVTKIVEECSDDKGLDKIKRKEEQIKHASHISDSAKLVKAADKYSNIRGLLETPPAFWSKDEIIGYVHWGFSVCRKISGVNSNVDSALIELFLRHKIDVEMTEKDLEDRITKYYRIIDKSE
jgi:(p)ppGpp synthase/HD superfamily hydrolase